MGKYKGLLLLLAGSIFLHVALHFKHFSLDIFGFHAWRQCQTLATAVSFYEEDFRLWNPKRNCRGNTEGLFRVEFPLFQWSIAALAHLSQTHPEKIGRISAYLSFLLAVGGMYFFLRSFFSVQGATMGTVGFLWSPALFYYSVSPLPDTLALGAALWGLGLWRRKQLLAGAGLLSLSIAVKLPFILLWALPMGEAFFSPHRGRLLFSTLLYGIFSLFLPVLWYSQSLLWTDVGLVKGIFAHDTSLKAYLHLLYHHLFSLLPETLIGYTLTIPFVGGMYYLLRKGTYAKPFILLGAVLLLYLLYELPTLQYAHDYYLFPWLPWTTLGITQALEYWGDHSKKLPFFFLLLAPIGAFARMHHRWDPAQPGFNPDLLRYKTELRAAVPDSHLVIMGIDESNFIFSYHLHKKGWCIPSLDRAKEVLETATKEGAAYLYSDHPALDSLARPFISQKVWEKGSFRVYKLHPAVMSCQLSLSL